MERNLSPESIAKMQLIQAMTSEDSLQRKLCMLAAQFKMEYKTEYGERVFTSTDFTSEIPNGSEIFIGNIPHNICEDIFIPIFSQSGKIMESRLLLDVNGTSKGYCYIAYQSVEAANRAIGRFHGYVLNQQTLYVIQSLNNCRLYLKNIPISMGKHEIEHEINRRFCGVVGILMQNTGNNHSQAAFVEFQTQKLAQEAYKSMWPSKLILRGIHISVEWAKPNRTTFKEHTSLCIKNLPTWATKTSLAKFIVSLTRSNSIITNIFRKKGGDTAIVEFTTIFHAHNTLNMLDGFNWNGYVLEVTWFNNNYQSVENNNFKEVCDFYVKATDFVPEEDDTESDDELMRIVNDVVKKGIDPNEDNVDIKDMFKLPRRERSSSSVACPNTTTHDTKPANIASCSTDLRENRQENVPLNGIDSPEENYSNNAAASSVETTETTEFVDIEKYLKNFDKGFLICKLYNQTVVNQHLFNILKKPRDSV